MHLRSRGFVLAPPTCKSRVQSQYAWPRNLKPKFIAIQQFLANACNSTRKGLQYAETPFPGKQLSAFRGLDGTCILVHFHLVTHMKICVKNVTDPVTEFCTPSLSVSRCLSAISSSLLRSCLDRQIVDEYQLITD